MAPENTEAVEETAAEGTSPGTPRTRAAGEGNVDSPVGEAVEPSRRFAKEAALRGHIDPREQDVEDGVSGPDGSDEGDPSGDPSTPDGDDDDTDGEGYSTSDVPENAEDAAKWISDGVDDDDKHARAVVAMEVEQAREQGTRSTVTDRAETYLRDTPDS